MLVGGRGIDPKVVRFFAAPASWLVFWFWIFQALSHYHAHALSKMVPPDVPNRFHQVQRFDIWSFSWILHSFRVLVIPAMPPSSTRLTRHSSTNMLRLRSQLRFGHPTPSCTASSATATPIGFGLLWWMTLSFLSIYNLQPRPEPQNLQGKRHHLEAISLGPSHQWKMV